jgi:C_GCAxxG_C_C family probable redox protein
MKTITEIEILMASEKAAKYFGNGFHCAEAVATAVLDAIGEESSEAAAHATAFGGGFGRTFQEACGALSGALIAIGHLHGRRELGGEWDIPAELGREIRQRFLDDFGTTNCATLRNRFGKERQMAECREVTKRVTATLLALLSENPDQ